MRVAPFPLLSDIIKNTTFLKTFRHCPLVLLIRILLKWNECRALVQRHWLEKAGVLEEKPVFVQKCYIMCPGHESGTQHREACIVFDISVYIIYVYIYIYIHIHITLDEITLSWGKGLIWRRRSYRTVNTHSSSVIKVRHLVLYNEIIVLRSEIHTKHISPSWAGRRMFEC